MSNLILPEPTTIPDSQLGSAMHNYDLLIQNAVCDLIVESVFQCQNGNVSHTNRAKSLYDDWTEISRGIDPEVVSIAAYYEDPEARRLVQAQVALKWVTLCRRRIWDNFHQRTQCKASHW